MSGSFKQVIPTYYSVDEKGNKTEFLNSIFENASEVCDNIFLKGYQWPFDSKKIHASSEIDLAVSRERAKGRRVYIDYRNNPEGFDFTNLSNTAKEYLLSAGADGKTPFDRLKQLNPQAIAFYKSKGVDLSKEPLEIAVCAQHINGGADIDINYQTNIENLFAVGETAGTFGIYRLGGSALNSTQVGALIAAEYISRSKADFADEHLIYKALWDESDYIEKCRNCLNDKVDFSENMSIYAAENRNINKISEMKVKLKKQCDLKYYYLNDENYETVLNLYRYRDTLRTQLMLCCAFTEILPETGSRGGAICTYNGAQIKENESYRDFAVLTDNENRSCFVPLRKLPDLNYSFESEWNRFNRERGITLA